MTFHLAGVGDAGAVLPMVPDAHDPPRARLPRLSENAYQGRAVIHWIMTSDKRATGWLDERLHMTLREVLLHVCHRYELVCPAYCLMPDHGHFLLLGMSEGSDQRRAVAWFRRHWNGLLAPRFSLQRQAYDHVLRDEEKARDAFVSVAHYVLANPERKGLVADWREWRFSGAVFPGVHPLDPRTPEYWERFWREYNRRMMECGGGRGDVEEERDGA